MNKEEILKKIRENREKIRSFGVKRIGIFGSAIREEMTEKSDIDVVVLWNLKRERRHLRMFVVLLISLRSFLAEKLIF